MKGTGKRKKVTSMLATVCFLTALALLLSTAGVTLAKYISQQKSSGAAVAKPFYFSSDKLGEELPYYQIDEPAEGGNAEITFTLSNFIDRLRRTEGALHYTYQAVSGSGPEGTAIAGTAGQGDFAGTDFETTPEIVLTLDPAAFEQDGTVTVIATATSPYKKTIGARFGFASEESEVQYAVSTQGDAVILELSGGDGGGITVAWPSELTPDLTNTVFQGASANSVTFVPETGKRYALTFLMTEHGKEYTAQDFTVTQS